MKLNAFLVRYPLIFTFLVCSQLLLSLTAFAEDIWVLNHANIIDVNDTDETIKRDMAVIVEGKIIKSIVSSSQIPSHIPKIIDAKGAYLLPGLVDMHVHVWDKPELKAYLAKGVTSVRNASGMPYLLEYQSDIEAGQLVGPRLITTGPILNSSGPNSQANHQIVETAEQAIAAVNWQYQQGFKHLKVYSNLSTEAYQAILIEAQKLGMSVMGHPPEGKRDPGIPFDKPFHIEFESILDDNLVTIEHVESIVWHALKEDINSQAFQTVARKIAQAKVAVTPTLIAHHNLIKVAQTHGDYLQRSGTETLNPFITALEKDVYDYWSSRPKYFREDLDRFYLEATKILYDSDVKLVAGSDSGIFTNIPGISLIDELMLLQKAGLPNLEVLKSATINAAETLNEATQFGAIQENLAADLVLYSENPLDKLTTLYEPKAVIKAGRYFSEDELKQLWKEASESNLERSQAQIYKALEQQESFRTP